MAADPTITDAQAMSLMDRAAVEVLQRLDQFLAIEEHGARRAIRPDAEVDNSGRAANTVLRERAATFADARRYVQRELTALTAEQPADGDA